jgi:transcriptional regulator with XRE-family HTH domain
MPLPFKLNYSEIAKRTKLSASHVSRVYRGKRQPSMRVLKLLAEDRGMRIDELDRELGKNGKR